VAAETLALVFTTLDLGIGIRSVAIAPDGKTALSGSRDATLRLWVTAVLRQSRSIAACDPCQNYFAKCVDLCNGSIAVLQEIRI
jgi:hypothetical protein